MRRGKIIVIDGIDGSGKTVQAHLLVKRLRHEGFKVKTLDFPQYKKNFFGGMVREYLSGEFGDAAKIDARLVSPLYAFDRWESAPKIRKWLSQGFIVVLNRYATSNLIHQVAKKNGEGERIKLSDWLDKLEYKVLSIPRPDLVVFLSVPPKTSLRLLAGRKEKRHNGKRDMHENMAHLKKAFKAGHWAAKREGWAVIDCVDADGAILSRETIAGYVLKTVGNFLRTKKSVRKK